MWGAPGDPKGTLELGVFGCESCLDRYKGVSGRQAQCFLFFCTAKTSGKEMARPPHQGPCEQLSGVGLGPAEDLAGDYSEIHMSVHLSLSP